MTPAAAYYRYSSALQNQTSIERQRDTVRLYCDRNDFQLVAEYRDEAKTGKHVAGRTGLESLLTAARDGKFAAVIVEDWKRWGRDLRESLMMFWEMEDAGVEIVSSTGDNHPLMRLFSMYQAEADNAERARVVRKSLRLGVHAGRAMGTPPLGYRKIPITRRKNGTKTGGNLIIDENERPTVEALFRLWASGLGTRLVAQQLNAMRLFPRRRPHWSAKTVQQILQNPLYTGALVWGRITYERGQDRPKPIHLPPEQWEWVEGQHPAYITRKDFDATQKRIDANATKTGRTSKHALTDFMVCDYCGKSFTYRLLRHATDAYVCTTTHRHHRADCPNSPILIAHKIEDFVSRFVGSEALSDDAMRAFLGHTGRDRYREAQRQIDAAIREAEKRVGNLTDAVAATGLSAALQTALAKAERELDALKNDLVSLENRKPPTGAEVRDLQTASIARLKSGDVGSIRRVYADVELQVRVSAETVRMTAKFPGDDGGDGIRMVKRTSEFTFG